MKRRIIQRAFAVILILTLVVPAISQTAFAGKEEWKKELAEEEEILQQIEESIQELEKTLKEAEVYIPELPLELEALKEKYENLKDKINDLKKKIADAEISAKREVRGLDEEGRIWMVKATDSAPEALNGADGLKVEKNAKGNYLVKLVKGGNEISSRGLLWLYQPVPKGVKAREIKVDGKVTTFKVVGGYWEYAAEFNR